MPSVVAAMIGLCVLLLTGVLSWNDCLSEKSAWDTLAWFAVLIGMSAQVSAACVHSVHSPLHCTCNSLKAVLLLSNLLFRRLSNLFSCCSVCHDFTPVCCVHCSLLGLLSFLHSPF